MKETYYFSHDYNCREDEKMMKLIRVLWMEWFWIYWAVIESLAQNWWILKIESIDDIAYWLHIDKQKVQDLIFNFDLFWISDDNNDFFSERLLKHFEKRDKIKEKKSEAWKKWMAKRWGNHNTVITENESVITEHNKGKETKVKESKVNIISKDIIKKEFDSNSFEYITAKNFFNFHIDLKTVSLSYLLTKKDEEEVLQIWSDEVRKLKQIDKYTEEQIDYIIKFIQWDDFRIKQIQTLSKLRSKNKYWVPYFVVMIWKVQEMKWWNTNSLSIKNNWWTARI